jgi:hypothetical protein
MYNLNYQPVSKMCVFGNQNAGSQTIKEFFTEILKGLCTGDGMA